MADAPTGLILTPEQQDRIMSIHDSIMASLKQSLAAHEGAKQTIEAQKATLAEREATIAERDATVADQAKRIEDLLVTAANAVDSGEVSAMLSQIDAASAGIRDLVAPAPAA